MWPGRPSRIESFASVESLFGLCAGFLGGLIGVLLTGTRVVRSSARFTGGRSGKGVMVGVPRSGRGSPRESVVPSELVDGAWAWCLALSGVGKNCLFGGDED